MTRAVALREAPRYGLYPLASSLTIGPISLWALVVASGIATGISLDEAGRRISIEAPPFHASFDPQIGWGLFGAVAIGAAAVVLVPVAARRLRWGPLLATSAAAATTFGLAVAAVRGWHRVIDPVRSPREYLAVLPRVHEVGSFLSTFTARLSTYPVHVQGHPPGPVLVAWALRTIGLGGPSAFAAVLVVGGALVVPAVLVVVRDVAGEDWARRAMPFLVLTPAVVWMITSADGLFAGVGAVGVALVVLSTSRRGPRGELYALLGGVVLGVCAFLSYALVLLGVIPLVIAWHRRRLRAVCVACVGATIVVVSFRTAGFWWVDGLVATHGRYVAGIAAQRPYLPFVLIDLAAFAVVVGPATAVALHRLRSRDLWLLVGGGLAIVTIAALSGMTKGEVERIWLPFAPWVLVGAAILSAPLVHTDEPRAPLTLGRDRVRHWLALQVTLTILIETLVLTPW